MAPEAGSLASGGRRPNTIQPDSFFKLTDAGINAMSDEDIRRFLDESQGVRVHPETPRTALLSKLQSVAIAARDL